MGALQVRVTEVEEETVPTRLVGGVGIKTSVCCVWGGGGGGGYGEEKR